METYKVFGKSLKYNVFKTNWGYFGLAGTEYVLFGTCLPMSRPEGVKSQLLRNLSLLKREAGSTDITYKIEFDRKLFTPVQDVITAYFEGAIIDFDTTLPVMLDGFSNFIQQVFSACRNIKFGQVITYSDLAKRIGRPTASRAVGNALSKNPLPLIIPCHRVIRSNGRLGGFSAPGGIELKTRLLQHEHSIITNCRST
jgi:methylated-DNA-[protein]-cysteine S-methyltransferase